MRSKQPSLDITPMCDSTGPVSTGVGKISSIPLLYFIIQVCLIAWSGSQDIHDQRSNDQMDSPHRWQVIWKVLSWHSTIMLTLAKLWLCSPGLGLGCPRSSHLNSIRSKTVMVRSGQATARYWQSLSYCRDSFATSISGGETPAKNHYLVTLGWQWLIWYQQTRSNEIPVLSHFLSSPKSSHFLSSPKSKPPFTFLHVETPLSFTKIAPMLPTGREPRSGVKCILVTIVTGSLWLVRRYRWGQVNLKTISTIPSH